MYLFEGSYFKTRQIKDSDAEFIFNLRRSDRAYGLNPISSDIQEQRDFIEKSNQQTKNKDSIYLIIENLDLKRVGAFRLTELGTEKASYQSLISVANAEPNVIIETIFCVYQIFFEILKLNNNPKMTVKNQAIRVIKLHNKMGFTNELSKDDDFSYFEISKEKFKQKKEFYNNIGYGLKNYSNFLKFLK